MGVVLDALYVFVDRDAKESSDRDVILGADLTGLARLSLRLI